MPQMDLDVASTAAERLRQEIATYDFKGITCTASLGVSSISLGAKTMQDLIDEADKCLYAAKRGGRNQVMRWDEVPDAIEIDDSSIARKPAGEETVSSRPAISFQTVSALLSALGSRDTASAEHSRRVADLCVRTAKGLVAISDSFILENAALLHDIGKIGVPDSVLLKPGPLTPEERHIIFSHDQIGVEIVRSTFDCEQMTQIILCHRAHYSGSESRFGLPVGKDILLGARILSICEAYDAMVHDLVYRAAMTSEEAFAELLRCAGQQFDPDLANRFITMMKFEAETNIEPGDGVSMATVLQLGVQIDKMANAMDQEDRQSLVRVAGQIRSTATQGGCPHIANLAAELEQAEDEQQAWVDCLEAAVDLIELCRSTQRAHLPDTANLSMTNDVAPVSTTE